MGESADGDRTHGEETTGNEELRTIGFRLREIQRLLAVRVEQENRRLAAEGVEPVSEADRFRSEGADPEEGREGDEERGA